MKASETLVRITRTTGYTDVKYGGRKFWALISGPRVPIHRSRLCHQASVGIFFIYYILGCIRLPVLRIIKKKLYV